MSRYVVLASGRARAGLREYVESWLRRHGADTLTNFRVYSDYAGAMFLRAEFECRAALGVLKQDFGTAAVQWPLDAWHIQALERTKILLLASRADHVVHELLALQQQGRLAGDVVQVVANQPDLRGFTEAYGVSFLHLAWPSQQVDPAGDAAARNRLAQLIKNTGAGLVVMARFMQIPLKSFEITPVINVHHACSVALPGASTHRWMAEGGVKVLTATAHYATAGLGQGPIIAQESRTAEALGPAPSTSVLQAASRPIEALVLATAVNWHCQGELLVRHGRTVHLTP